MSTLVSSEYQPTYLLVGGLLARGLILAGVDDGGGEALLVERLAEHVAAALAVTEDHDGRLQPAAEHLGELVLLLVLLEHEDLRGGLVSSE